MSGTTREVWRHRRLDYLWVVELSAGRITGAYGPLKASDAGESRLEEPWYERNVELLRSLERCRDEFVPMEAA